MKKIYKKILSPDWLWSVILCFHKPCIARRKIHRPRSIYQITVLNGGMDTAERIIRTEHENTEQTTGGKPRKNTEQTTEETKPKKEKYGTVLQDGRKSWMMTLQKKRKKGNADGVC